jgi:hypothetical protein
MSRISVAETEFGSAILAAGGWDIDRDGSSIEFVARHR